MGLRDGAPRPIDHREVQIAERLRDQQSAIVVDYSLDHTCYVRRPRQVLSTTDRPLLLFISHSVGVPWPNFLSPDIRTKSRRKNHYFWRDFNFL